MCVHLYVYVILYSLCTFTYLTRQLHLEVISFSSVKMFEETVSNFSQSVL